MESKKDIRSVVLAKRNQIEKKEWEEKSHQIFKKVITHPFFLNADAIYCYLDYRNEVGTIEIIEYAMELGKKVAAPKVYGDRMRFHYIESVSDVQTGYCDIREPRQTEIVAQDVHALVIMPGAAFDRNRHRIGYGKGFYDRYLEQNPQCHTMALAFSFQMMDAIPCEEHDICPEVIITEEQIYV